MGRRMLKVSAEMFLQWFRAGPGWRLKENPLPEDARVAWVGPSVDDSIRLMIESAAWPEVGDPKYYVDPEPIFESIPLCERCGERAKHLLPPGDTGAGGLKTAHYCDACCPSPPASRTKELVDEILALRDAVGRGIAVGEYVDCSSAGPERAALLEQRAPDDDDGPDDDEGDYDDADDGPGIDLGDEDLDIDEDDDDEDDSPFIDDRLMERVARGGVVSIGRCVEPIPHEVHAAGWEEAGRFGRGCVFRRDDWACVRLADGSWRLAGPYPERKRVEPFDTKELAFGWLFVSQMRGVEPISPSAVGPAGMSMTDAEMAFAGRYGLERRHLERMTAAEIAALLDVRRREAEGGVRKAPEMEPSPADPFAKDWSVSAEAAVTLEPEGRKINFREFT